ncbi:histidinol-phosphate aminotransferase 1 [Peptoclostridium acidaminophilum DSM 3953]|uniref:Aminotransferase n=1 Tax=Peptoclostridium acidaminophilum DSM 3953 TaxID=1286171 RepID=W8T8M2_PEPAC|nr:histidinol-phosphate transaminase [Peptoclostridium acidaminophilum]AHM57205.1 histidinol-phosphate aminotransferase 1 [Peptoclostridium acidaminophilum DSM 3953]
MLKLKKNIEGIERTSYVKDDNEDLLSDGLVDCSLGTNPFGCSEQIHLWGELGKANVNSYPNHPYKTLREAICSYWKGQAGIVSGNVIIGNGSISILSKVSGMIVDSGTRVLGYCPQFTDYAHCVRVNCGTYEQVDLRRERKLRFDASEFKGRVGGGYGALYIDNPNNPTGQVLELSDIESIVREAKRQGVWAIVDEAYGDFMDKENSAVSLVGDYENLIVVRSFSKGFGLAGLRVGYAVCSEEFADLYRRVDTPFGISSPGHLAAVLALGDEAFLKDSAERVKANKEAIIDSCYGIKVMHTSMRVPIMTLEHPDHDTDFKGLLIENGVLTESGSDFVNLGKNHVRLRVPRETGRLLEALRRIEEGI